MILQSNDLDVKDTSQKTTVPNNPYARLMYYINSICSLIPIDKLDEKVSYFRDYKNYNKLSDSEQNAVVQLALLLKPDLLTGKIIFYAPELCQGYNNRFL